MATAYTSNPPKDPYEQARRRALISKLTGPAEGPAGVPASITPGASGQSNMTVPTGKDSNTFVPPPVFPTDTGTSMPGPPPGPGPVPTGTDAGTFVPPAPLPTDRGVSMPGPALGPGPVPTGPVRLPGPVGQLLGVTGASGAPMSRGNLTGTYAYNGTPLTGQPPQSTTPYVTPSGTVVPMNPQHWTSGATDERSANNPPQFPGDDGRRYTTSADLQRTAVSGATGGVTTPTGEVIGAGYTPSTAGRTYAAPSRDSDPNAPPPDSREGQQDTGELPPTGTDNRGSNPPAPGQTGSPYEGFDFGREQNPRYSAKDSFSAAFRNAPPAPINDRAALAAWFTQYIQPAMERDGHRINWVNEDKFNFTSPQGTFTVDFARGAGAGGGALTWQVDGIPGEGGAPAPAGGGGAAPGAGGGGGGGGSTNPFGDDVRRRILELMGMDISGIGDSQAVRAQMSAYERAQQRQAEQAQAGLAERRNAQGLGSSGAFDTDLERMRQLQGEQGGSFNAGLVGEEINRVREMGMQALQMGAGILSADQEIALRRWLGELQNAQFNLGLGYNYDQLGFNYTQLQLDQRWRDWLIANGLA